MNNRRIQQLLTSSGLVLTALTFAATGCRATHGDGLHSRMQGDQVVSDWKPLHAERHGNTWQSAGNVQIDAADPTKLVITPGEGIHVNGPAGKTCDVYSAQSFGDCMAHVEFMVPQGSNSGVYFMGEYEIQVFDSYGKPEVTFSDCGGIYSRWIDEKNVEGHAPMVNASKPPGEWQTFDVVFRAPRFDADGKKIANARFIEVRHNGKIVHKDVELNGPTRAGISGKENATGPLMLQGDHGPVAYRNIRVKP